MGTEEGDDPVWSALEAQPLGDRLMATVDGHAEDVKLELGTEARPPEPEAPDTRIADAIAATVGCETDDLLGWATIVEYKDGDGSTIRTLWSGDSTPWGLRGYTREMVRHAEAMSTVSHTPLKAADVGTSTAELGRLATQAPIRACTSSRNTSSVSSSATRSNTCCVPATSLARRSSTTCGRRASTSTGACTSSTQRTSGTRSRGR